MDSNSHNAIRFHTLVRLPRNLSIKKKFFNIYFQLEKCRNYFNYRCLTLLIIALICIILGTFRLLLQILLMVTGVAGLLLSARVLYRYVGCLLWIFILATLTIHVKDVDTLITWTLGFFFGGLSIVALNVLFAPAHHLGHMIVFSHMMLFLIGIFTMFLSLKNTHRNYAHKAGEDGNIISKSDINRCFSWGIVSGTLYVGILEELTMIKYVRVMYRQPNIH